MSSSQSRALTSGSNKMAPTTAPSVAAMGVTSANSGDVTNQDDKQPTEIMANPNPVRACAKADTAMTVANTSSVVPKVASAAVTLPSALKFHKSHVAVTATTAIADIGIGT